MINSYLNVRAVTKLAAKFDYLGFIINANLQQGAMVVLGLILMTTETKGLRVWRMLKHSFNKATCNAIKFISPQK